MGRKQAAKRRRVDTPDAAEGSAAAAVQGSVASAQAAAAAAQALTKAGDGIEVFQCFVDGRPRAKAARAFAAGELVASFPFDKALSVQSAPDAVLEAVDDALALAMKEEDGNGSAGSGGGGASDDGGTLDSDDDDLEDDIDWGQGDGGFMGASAVDMR